MWKPMSEAPHGGIRKVNVGRGGQRDIFEPVMVLSPTSDGKVIFTWWLPEAERWCNFTKEHPPQEWWDFGDGQPSPPLPTRLLGMTDLMVSPEAIDNLPDDEATE